jgi:excisionase family DNA binding protein
MENDFEQPLNFLTLRETADMLQLSTRTLQRLLKDKKLPAVKIGSQCRVHESDLTKFIDHQQQL